jgi:DNA-binding HxlR family transcriptional regulator
MNDDKFGICPFVTSQKILQGKWAILIMSSLCHSAKRFNELQKEINIAQATLSTQLKFLEKEGLISRKVYPEVPPRVEYSLTSIGREFQPVLESIKLWGNKYIEYLKAHRNN